MVMGFEMTPNLWLAVLIVGLALTFDFTNGFNDSANIVATMISSRALSPVAAFVIAALFEFIGAYFLGTEVAATIGGGIIDPGRFSGRPGVLIVMASVGGAICWNLIARLIGIPSSSSHALIGAMLGAFIFAGGFNWGERTFSFHAGAALIHWNKVGRIFLVLISAPLIGGFGGFFFMHAIRRIFRYAPPAANRLFKRLQILSSITLALSHGSNDAQKTMGIITMSMIMLGYQAAPDGTEGFHVQKWVILACSAAMALGIATGGWSIIKTVGMKIFKVRAVHGFSAQTSSTGIIYAAAVLGFPVSTTQIVTSSVMGTGAAERLNAVRWEIVGTIVSTWLITIPGSAIIGSVMYVLLYASF